MPVVFSGNQWMATEKPINIEKNITIEALLTLDGNGNDPTILSQPLSSNWEAPFVAYRLGFLADTCKPLFEFSLQSDAEYISLVSPDPVSKKTALHVAGTYDGSEALLYVDGQKVQSKKVNGLIARSDQPAVLGGRSSTDNGGFLIGSLYEVRLMKCIRTPEEIDFWHNTKLGPIQVWNVPDTPRPPDKKDYLGLWST